MAKLHNKKKYARENARNYNDRIRYMLAILAFVFL